MLSLILEESKFGPNHIALQTMNEGYLPARLLTPGSVGGQNGRSESTLLSCRFSADECTKRVHVEMELVLTALFSPPGRGERLWECGA